MSKGVVPANTNKWALKNLEEWMEMRKKIDEPVPDDLLSCCDAHVVCKWLCRFVQETRKIDGSRYPASSIRSLLAAFQQIMQANKLPYRLFDASDTRFLDLRNTLDTVSMSLRKEGIGVSKSHAAVISSEDQKLMWESGVLGTDSPWALVRAVFVITGLHFSLRGGQEHRDLTIDQFKRFPDESSYDEHTYYEYTEHGSKNYQGKFADMDNKICKVYAQPSSLQCPVRILDLYFRKLPSNAKAFYMQPLQKVPTDSVSPWFTKCPIGVNPLKNMMPNISRLAGLSAQYTNHSLRATSATRMFTAGIPEKIIAEHTGLLPLELSRFLGLSSQKLYIRDIYRTFEEKIGSLDPSRPVVITGTPGIQIDQRVTSV